MIWHRLAVLSWFIAASPRHNIGNITADVNLFIASNEFFNAFFNAYGKLQKAYSVENDSANRDDGEPPI